MSIPEFPNTDELFVFMLNEDKPWKGDNIPLTAMVLDCIQYYDQKSFHCLAFFKSYYEPCVEKLGPEMISVSDVEVIGDPLNGEEDYINHEFRHRDYLIGTLERVW